MSHREDLIRIYATHPIADVKTLAEFQNLRATYEQDPVFRGERDEIETAKVWVEEALDKPQTIQKQVQAAITLLVEARGDEPALRLFYDLITAGYKPKWQSHHQQYFEEAWKRVQLKYDFFLSFTCRYPPVTGDNPVNTIYKQFIISEIGVDEYQNADRKKANLLAAAVHRLLCQPRLKGFYFPHSQYDNSLTEDKLRDACNSSLVFVQLVQAIMFDRPASGGKNYCHFEWNQVTSTFSGPDKDERILFLVAETDRPTLLAILPYFPYSTWHAAVTTKDPPYLPEVEFLDEAKLKDIKSTVREVATKQIRWAWNRMINRVPV